MSDFWVGREFKKTPNTGPSDKVGRVPKRQTSFMDGSNLCFGQLNSAASVYLSSKKNSFSGLIYKVLGEL